MANLINYESPAVTKINFLKAYDNFLGYLDKKSKKNELNDAKSKSLYVNLKNLRERLIDTEKWFEQPISTAIFALLNRRIIQYRSHLTEMSNEGMARAIRKYLQLLLSYLYDIQRDLVCKILRKEIATHLAKSLADDIERIADTGKDDELVLIILNKLALEWQNIDTRRDTINVWLRNAIAPLTEEDDEGFEDDCNLHLIFLDEAPYVKYKEQDNIYKILDTSSQKFANELNSHRGLLESGETKTIQHSQLALSMDLLEEYEVMFGKQFLKIFNNMGSSAHKLRIAKEILALWCNGKIFLDHQHFIKILQNPNEPLTRALKTRSFPLGLFDCLTESVWAQVEYFILPKERSTPVP